MTDLKWNLTHLPLRNYIDLLMIKPLIENIPIKLTDTILEIRKDTTFAFEALSNSLPEGHLTKLNVGSLNLTPLNEKRPLNLDNQFNIVFSFFKQYHVNIDLVPYFFKRIYDLLKPGGHFFFIMPSTKNTTYKTLIKVIETKSFPELNKDPFYYDKTLVTKVFENIKSIPFKDPNMDTFKGEIELPNTAIFRQYLHETTFLYMKILPTKTSRAIIDKQVELFDAYCEEKHEGKCIYNYELITFHLRK